MKYSFILVVGVFLLLPFASSDDFDEYNADDLKEREYYPPLPPFAPNRNKTDPAVCTTQSSVMKKCYIGHAASGTQSPCSQGCMDALEIKYGDPCDPQLMKFLRRAFDDALAERKNWSLIIGSTFTDVDSDYKYVGECTFMCPAALCMEVVKTSDYKTQYIDIVKFDCVQLPDRRKLNDGVCTCGHQYSWVDPANSKISYDDGNALVRYEKTIGLDRKLMWDESNKRCAADRYGHCSLDWEKSNSPFKYDESLRTYCWNKDHTCVNRSATVLNSIYKPIRSKDTKLWYGICDNLVLIADPFADGGGESAYRTGSRWIYIIKLIAIAVFSKVVFTVVIPH